MVDCKALVRVCFKRRFYEEGAIVSVPEDEVESLTTGARARFALVDEAEESDESGDSDDTESSAFPPEPPTRVEPSSQTAKKASKKTAKKASKRN